MVRGGLIVKAQALGAAADQARGKIRQDFRELTLQHRTPELLEIAP